MEDLVFGEKQPWRKGGGIYFEQIARLYKYIDREQLRQCLRGIAMEFNVSRFTMYPMILDHTINHLHLDGVASYYKLESKKYNKTVHLFGEYHFDMYTCKHNLPQVTFSDILRAKIANSSLPLDVFFESPYLDPGTTRPPNRSVLKRWDEILQNFGDCLQRDKTDCPYRDNVRFHFADFRRSEVEPIIFYNTASELLSDLIMRGILNEKPEKAKKLLEFIQQGFSNTKERILAVPRLKKQLKAVKGPTKNKLTEWFDLDNLEKEWNNIIPTINKLANSTTEVGGGIWPCMTELRKTWKTIVKYTGYIMDLYLMARVLRSFRHTPHKYSEDPTTVFVYVGEQHARSYKKFLSKSLGFSLTNHLRVKVVQSTDVCVALPEKFKKMFKKESQNQTTLKSDHQNANS
jgi:hypothetical protein